MIEFSKEELITMIHIINQALTPLKERQNRYMLEAYELKEKELLHSIDGKLDQEFTRVMYQPRILRDL